MTEDLHLLTGAYVLDSLDEVERAHFERHLAACPECAAEVRELRRTVAEMGAAFAAQPPVRMREAVLSRAARTPQVTPHPRVLTGRRWPRVVTSLAAAAVVAAVSFGAGAWFSERQVEQQVVASESVAGQVLSAPDAKIMASTLSNGAMASVVVSQSLGRAVMLTDGMPMPKKKGDCYQVWMVDAQGRKKGLEVFTPTDGQATLILTGEMGDMTGFAVTEEPAGGSQQPTTEPLGMVAT